MRTIFRMSAGAAFLALLLIGCKSTSFSKEAQAANAENGFVNAGWSADGKTPAKVMVGKTTLVISSQIDTGKIPDGSNVNIVVSYENNGKTGMVDLLSATVENGRISKEWTVKDNSSFYQQKGIYSVPAYSFKLSSENGKSSAESEKISVYGFIRAQVKNTDGELKRNQKVIIYKSDGTTLNARTDADGYIDLKWLPLGQYSFELIKEEADVPGVE